jgi:hypothetical protein
MLSIKHESLMIYYQMIILYSICYVQIQLHRVSKFVVLMYICYLTDICIPIQCINQVRHVQQLDEPPMVVTILLFTLCFNIQCTPVFSGLRATRTLASYVCFIDRCFSFCTFFFWTLCCLFFDIRILIAPLVSLISS